MEYTPEQRKLIRDMAVAQITQIANHGCSGIKCKRCSLVHMCDKVASHSKDLALSLITYAKSLPGDK